MDTEAYNVDRETDMTRETVATFLTQENFKMFESILRATNEAQADFDRSIQTDDNGNRYVETPTGKKLFNQGEVLGEMFDRKLVGDINQGGYLVEYHDGLPSVVVWYGANEPIKSAWQAAEIWSTH